MTATSRLLLMLIHYTMIISVKRSLVSTALAVGIIASFLAAPPAHAQLTQTQVNSIIGLLQSFGADASTIANVNAALSGSPVSGTSSCTFTRNLTLGASGSDVTCLQQLLISKGFSIPAGATGLFGAQTQAALAAYQRAQGITPAIGYFGPVTRVALSSATPAPTPTTPTPSRGDEGQLKRFSTIGGVEFEVKEGEKNVRILGIEFDADDSDMRIDRIDVDFEKSNGSGSNRLERYVQSVSLRLGNREIATQNVSRGDRKDDIYSFRFSGLNAVVREDDTAELYVVVNAAQNIDSADEDTEWTVRIPSRGIRATDGAGISDTYAGSDLSESITFGEATQGSLRITSGDDNPEDDVIVADDSKETTGVELLSFELRARNQNITIEDIPVSLAITGNATHVGEVVRSVKLLQGSKTLKTKTIPSSAGLYEEIVFDNLDLEINDDSTETFTVVADIRKLDGNFGQGDSVTASTTASMSGWDVEDERGDSVEPTGSVTGGTLYFFTSGISVKLVSVNESKTFRAGEAGQADIGEFKITFDVTAIGDDIYLDRSTTRTENGVAGDGFTWATTTETTTGLTVVASYISSPSSDSNDTDNLYRVREDQTRRFTATVALEADQNGVAAVRLTGINWTTDSSDVTPDNFYTVNLSDLKTGIMTLLVL